MIVLKFNQLLRRNASLFAVRICSQDRIRNLTRAAVLHSFRFCADSEFLVFGGRGISNLVHSYDNTERLWRKRPVRRGVELRCGLAYVLQIPNVF